MSQRMKMRLAQAQKKTSDPKGSRASSVMTQPSARGFCGAAKSVLGVGAFSKSTLACTMSNVKALAPFHDPQRIYGIWKEPS